MLSALGVTYAISREAHDWVLWVAPEDVRRALRDLEDYEAELREQLAQRHEEVSAKEIGRAHV